MQILSNPKNLIDCLVIFWIFVFYEPFNSGLDNYLDGWVYFKATAVRRASRQQLFKEMLNNCH